MRVLLIDPWAINSTAEYTNGLAYGLSKKVDLTLITNYYFQKTTKQEYKVYRYFFKKSEKIPHNRARSIIRGMEYIYAYIKVKNLLKKEKKFFDIIHINWLLMYKADRYFLKLLKKYCNKLVYTAHNILPHINGEQYIEDLDYIYKQVDTIILHGEGIKNEFKQIFPQYVSKVYIQRHGCILEDNSAYKIKNIDDDLIEKIENFKRIYIFFGNMFYNKGVDRIVKFWLDNSSSINDLLIVAGRKSPDYAELTALEDDIKKCSKIIYFNNYVEKNLLNYLISQSNLVLLPYRHASMSGVVFTAAEFKKPILCTATGAIKEYLENDYDSFVVNDMDSVFQDKLLDISHNYTNEILEKMGNDLNGNIKEKYSWDVIAQKLIKDVYIKVGD